RGAPATRQRPLPPHLGHALVPERRAARLLPGDGPQPPVPRGPLRVDEGHGTPTCPNAETGSVRLLVRGRLVAGRLPTRRRRRFTLNRRRGHGSANAPHQGSPRLESSLVADGSGDRIPSWLVALHGARRQHTTHPPRDLQPPPARVLADLVA